MVLQAHGQAPEARAALGELCEAYWNPVYQFLRWEGRNEDDSQELAQEFFTRILSGDGFGRMHLNRKVLLGIQNLEQQGKAFAIRAVPEDLLAVVGPKVIESISLEGAMIHHRLVFGAVHHLPRLPDGAAILRKCPLVAVFELSTTPYAFHVEGLECDGFHGRTYEFHCWFWQGLTP